MSRKKPAKHLHGPHRKLLRLLACFIVLGTSSGAACALDISLSKVELDEGRAYMGPGGFPTTKPLFADVNPANRPITALWSSKQQPDHVDSYRQPWRSFPLEQFESIVGPIHRHVLIVRILDEPESEKLRCNVVSDSNGVVSVIENCSPPVRSLEFEARTVTNGLLIEWGCDDSVIPAVDLGAEPLGNNGYDGSRLFAFSANAPLPTPKFEKVANPQLPASVSKQFALNYDALQVDFGDGVERWIIYFSDFVAGPYLWLIEHPMDEERRTVTQAVDVYGRC